MANPQFELIRQAIQEIWNDGRVEKAHEFFASDYVNHGGLIPDLVHGPEAIRISVVLYRHAFQRLSIRVDELRTEGEFIVLQWTARNRSLFGLCRARFNSAQTDHLMGRTRIRVSAGMIAETWMELSEESLQVIVPSGVAA